MVDISRRKFIYTTALLAPSYKLFAAAIEVTNNYFLHGIASGDPMQNSLIIWTRVTDSYAQTSVTWELAADRLFKKGLQTGIYQISEKSDYTVKIDVKQLLPGTVYYYRFKYRGVYSQIGTTKTLPVGLGPANFNMAVLCCNNWEDGYFNSFRFLAQKKEVDLVLHLGDYIYEYATGEYGDTSIGRINSPLNELLTLKDYRQRYAQYHTDPDLQLLHASKPWCLIWDDHEFANDAYMDGAKNHQPNEGDWNLRKRAAMQAYFEWLPIRATKSSEMQRSIRIGNDIELFLLEERMQGRTKQMDNTEPGFNDDSRSMLGSLQYQWLTTQLKQSKAKWKLIGNQVMFTGYAVAEGFKLPKYNDWWLGYPYERNKLVNFIDTEKIENAIFLTGDHHESFVLALHPEKEFMKYEHGSDKKPVAWELLTPSITSRNGDRLATGEIKAQEEMLYRKDINPHLVYGDIKSHGYFIATLSPTKFTAAYYFVDNLRSRTATEHKAASFDIDALNFTIQKS